MSHFFIFLLYTEYNKVSARIRIQLKQFDNEVLHLERKLITLGRTGKTITGEVNILYIKA